MEYRKSCGRYLVLPALGSVGIGLQLQGPAEGTLQAGGHGREGGDRRGADDAPFPVATLGPGLSDHCTPGTTELQTSGWEPPAPPEHPRPAHEPQADKQPHVQEKRWQGSLASPEASKGTGWGTGGVPGEVRLVYTPPPSSAHGKTELELLKPENRLLLGE